ncbi:MAG: flavodoxin family protein [Candidatus Bathyarchaeia archaeon]|jgi:multimeric flavodoxin WrbA
MDTVKNGLPACLVGDLVMNVLAISGSPRPNGNTDLLLAEALQAAKTAGAQTQLLRLSDYHLEPCQGCMTCASTGKCIQKDDGEALYKLLTEADGIILGSPSYFQSVTGPMKNFIDRMGFLGLQRKKVDFIGKVGGVVAVARRSGVSSTCNQMLTFFTALGVVIPSGGRVYAIARDKGDVLNDKEGMDSARSLGKSLVKALGTP